MPFEVITGVAPGNYLTLGAEETRPFFYSSAPCPPDYYKVSAGSRSEGCGRTPSPAIIPSPTITPSPQPPPQIEPTYLGMPYKTAAVVGTVVAGAMAYHGYKRNKSVGWAIGWALLGGIAPIITVPVALAQGFGRPKGK